jgi:hypothetical protein
VIGLWAARLGGKLALGGGACCSLTALAFMGVVIVVVARLLRGLRGDEAALDDALLALGYTPAELTPDQVTTERTLVARRCIVRFREGPKGHTWTAALQEYLPGEVTIEEREEEWPPRKVPGAFQIGDPDLDDRFRFVSERKSMVLEGLATPAVHEALLACAVVHVVARGDEIVFTDPERANLAARWGRPVRSDRLGTRRAIEAQVRVHREVVALLEALAASL